MVGKPGEICFQANPRRAVLDPILHKMPQRAWGGRTGGTRLACTQSSPLELLALRAARFGLALESSTTGSGGGGRVGRAGPARVCEESGRDEVTLYCVL